MAVWKPRISKKACNDVSNTYDNITEDILCINVCENDQADKTDPLNLFTCFLVINNNNWYYMSNLIVLALIELVS